MIHVSSTNNRSDLFKGALKPYIVFLVFNVCWKFHPIFITSQPVMKVSVQELRIYHKWMIKCPVLGEKVLRSAQDQISARVSLSKRLNKRKRRISVISSARNFGKTFVNLRRIYLSDTFCNFWFLIFSISTQVWLNA